MKYTLLSLIFFAFSPVALAYEVVDLAPLVPGVQGCANIPCSCRCDDAFEPRVRVTFGAYNGKCVDTCRFRTSTIISAEDSRWQHPVEKDKLVVANVRYRGIFNIAEIPLGGIEEMYYLVEHFGIWPANHAMLRIKFDKNHPVRLTPQYGDQSHPSEITDFIWTLRGVGAENESSNFGNAISGNIVNSFEFLATEDQYEFAVTVSKHVVEQHRLKLTQEERSEVLLELLKLGKKYFYSVPYNFGKDSCLGNMVRVLDTVLTFSRPWDYTESLEPRIDTPVSRTVPQNAVDWLKAVGIYDRRLVNFELDPELNPRSDPQKK